MLNMQKKPLILLTLILFLTGVLGMVQPGKAAAAKKTAVSPIGVVDYGVLFNQHPDIPEANKALQAENEQAKQEFESKSAGLSEKDKQELDQQLGQRVEQKRQELLSGITAKIDVAIREVADAQGITVVLPKDATIYGGQNITINVLEKITKK